MSVSTTRRRGAAKRAATRREDHALLRSFHSRGQPIGHTTCEQGGYLAKLNYMDIKRMIDRQQALNMKGTLTDGEIKSLVREWHDVRAEEAKLGNSGDGSESYGEEAPQV